jgi:hypothetical protein
MERQLELFWMKSDAELELHLVGLGIPCRLPTQIAVADGLAFPDDCSVLGGRELGEVIAEGTGETHDVLLFSECSIEIHRY